MRKILFFLFLVLKGALFCSASEAELSQNAAGILPMVKRGQDFYVLLAERERGQVSEEGWANFGGLGEEGEAETQTASRETFEESLGILNILGDQLKEEDSVQVGPFSSWGREGVRYRTFFVRVKNVIASDYFLEKLESATDHSQRELVNFKWIKLQDIRDHLGDDRFDAKTIEGKTINLKLLDNFKKTLVEAQSQGIFEREFDPITRSHSGDLETDQPKTFTYPFAKDNPELAEKQHHQLASAVVSKVNLNREFKELQKSEELPKVAEASVPQTPYTQTEAHMKLVLGMDYVEGDLRGNATKFLKKAYRVAHESTAVDSFVTMVQEEKKHPDHLVAYHAGNRGMMFLYDIYSEIRCLLTMDNNVSALRLLDNLFDEDLPAFLKKMREGALEERAFNYQRGYQDQAISVNWFLSGSYPDSGSFSFAYYLEGRSSDKIGPFEFIKRVFEGIGISVDVEKEYGPILQKLGEKNGRMVQLFFIPEVLSKMAYLSVGEGMPTKWNNGQKLTEDPVELLKKFKEDPNAAEAVLKETIPNPSYTDLRSDVIQGRIVLFPEFMNNPTDVLIKNYDLKELSPDYKTALRFQIARDMALWLKNNPDTKVFKDPKLQGYYDTIEKGITGENREKQSVALSHERAVQALVNEMTGRGRLSGEALSGYLKNLDPKNVNPQVPHHHLKGALTSLFELADLKGFDDVVSYIWKHDSNIQKDPRYQLSWILRKGLFDIFWIAFDRASPEEKDGIFPQLIQNMGGADYGDEKQKGYVGLFYTLLRQHSFPAPFLESLVSKGQTGLVKNLLTDAEWSNLVFWNDPVSKVIEALVPNNLIENKVSIDFVQVCIDQLRKKGKLKDLSELDDSALAKLLPLFCINPDDPLGKEALQILEEREANIPELLSPVVQAALSPRNEHGFNVTKRIVEFYVEKGGTLELGRIRRCLDLCIAHSDWSFFDFIEKAYPKITFVWALPSIFKSDFYWKFVEARFQRVTSKQAEQILHYFPLEPNQEQKPLFNAIAERYPEAALNWALKYLSKSDFAREFVEWRTQNLTLEQARPILDSFLPKPKQAEKPLLNAIAERYPEAALNWALPHVFKSDFFWEFVESRFQNLTSEQVGQILVSFPRKPGQEQKPLFNAIAERYPKADLDWALKNAWNVYAREFIESRLEELTKEDIYSILSEAEDGDFETIEFRQKLRKRLGAFQ